MPLNCNTANCNGGSCDGYPAEAALLASYLALAFSTTKWSAYPICMHKITGRHRSCTEVSKLSWLKTPVCSQVIGIISMCFPLPSPLYAGVFGRSRLATTLCAATSPHLQFLLVCLYHPPGGCWNVDARIPAVFQAVNMMPHGSLHGSKRQYPLQTSVNNSTLCLDPCVFSIQCCFQLSFCSVNKNLFKNQGPHDRSQVAARMFLVAAQ